MTAWHALFQRYGLTPLWLLVAGVAVGLALWRALPLALWAYNVEQAGRALDVALLWPEPRLADALPTVRDAERVTRARGHLAAAIRYRPTHAHAYRLAGQSYLAEGAWLQAAEALGRASQFAPDNPLLGWEAGLAYEALARKVEGALTESLVERLAAAEVEAPPEPIETPYCQPASSASCYVGQTSFKLPLAVFPDGPTLHAPTLFLHAPARVRLPLVVPSERPALHFLLGLDPLARTWGSDGAIFQVWVEPAQGPAQLVYEQAVDGPLAQQGWIPGWADLSPWVGQPIALVLGTATGPAGNGAGDWFGWGDVTLTTVEAARAAATAPQLRMIQAWTEAGFGAEQFFWRGEAAAQQQRWAEAYQWFSRAGWMGNAELWNPLFDRLVRGIRSGEPALDHLLVALQQTDPTLLPYPVRGTAEVPGSAFRWVRAESGTAPGTPLASPTGGDGTLDQLGEATVLLRVEEGGSYLLQPSFGPTGEASRFVATVGVDGNVVATLAFDATTGTVQSPDPVAVELTAGLHTLDLHLSRPDAGGEPTPPLTLEAVILHQAPASSPISLSRYP